jgi:chaperonin GroEL (HSP60 family)
MIMANALLSIETRIRANAGFTGDVKTSEEEGLDTRTKQVVNMFEAGIVDPKNVVLNACRNAISVAATVITAPTIVTLPRDEAPQEVPPVIR